MRTLLFVALITAAACSNTSVYPVPNLGHVDAGDSTQDGGSNHPTLLKFYVPGDEDGGPTGTKLPDGAVVSTRDEDGGMAGSTPTPDSGVTTHPQPDAGAQGSADAGPSAKHGTCGSCQTDADCLAGYSCVFHTRSTAKVCFAKSPPISCSTLPGGDVLVGTGTLCEPGVSGKGATLSCAQWHTATGL